jgi:hypothetical protein
MGRKQRSKKERLVRTECQNKNIKNISAAAAGRDSYLRVQGGIRGVGRNNQQRHAIPRQITILQFLKTKS